MARVVKQRTKIPYLLIIFAFLFVIATIFAIYFGVKIEDETKAKLAAQQQLVQKEGTPKTLQDRIDSLETDLQTLIREFYTGANPNAYKGATEIAKALKNEKSELLSTTRNPEYIGKIVKRRNVTTQSQIDEFYKRLEANSTVSGLLPDTTKGKVSPQISSVGIYLVLNKMGRDMIILADKAKELNRQRNDKASELNKAEALAEAKTAEYQDSLKEKSDRIIKLESELDDERKKIAKKLADAQDAFKEEIKSTEKDKEELNEKVANRDSIIDELKKKLAASDRIAADLRRKLRDKEANIINEADGKIIKVDPKSGICYVNIGSLTGARVGVTYVVYAPGAPRGDNGKNIYKAHIRITQVLGPKVSEARVTYMDNPKAVLLKGDEIANITVKSFRNYNFVVEGNFAMGTSSTATKLGRQKVINYLKKCGGEIQDDVNYKTDFLVLGDSMSKPINPGEDAEDTAREAYNRALKRYKKRQAIINKARSLGVKILNKNRFLEFTGMVPGKSS